MNSTTRVVAGFLLWAFIYGVSLYVIPGLEPVRGLREACPWIGSGDVTQFFFLIFSMTAMLIIGRGQLGEFGFKLVGPGKLVKPALISAGFAAGLFILGMVAMSVFEGGQPSGGSPEAEGAAHKLMPTFLKTLISIWIIASTVEEILYRGLVQTLLEPLRRYSIGLLKIRLTAPVLISGLAFGLGHLCLMRMFGGVLLVEIIVSCCAVGIIAAYYREKTESLLPAIAAHIAANVVGYGIPQILMRLMAMAKAGEG